jgi:predicted RNA-binding Zn ribbon-like protein
MDAVLAMAVRLVNTLTPGQARGHGYAPPAGPDLAGAATSALRAGNPGTHDLSGREATQLAGFAKALRTVFDGVAAGDADAAAHQVNQLLVETRARPWLERHDGEPWHMHFHGPDDSTVNAWAAGCATGLAIILGSDVRPNRLGVCTAPHCDRVYVDTSRNATRRFCSTSCQNRVKTAAFRARRG